MTSEIMDQSRLSSFRLPSAASSFFSEELRFPTERQVGFWKPESVPDYRGTEGMPLMSGSNPVSSSPLENLRPVGENYVECLELPHHYLFKEQKSKLGLDHHLMGAEKSSSLSMTAWRDADLDFGLRSDLHAESVSLSMKGNKVDLNRILYENGLFSSSLSELFDSKLRVSSNIAPLGQSVDTVNSNFGDVEPLESLAELQAQTIGNLLPDDDDLLSGVIDDIGYIAQPSSGDDMDDDIFCSGGGMELEGDDNTYCTKTSDFVGGGAPNGQQGGLNSQFSSVHPYREHPSRTLFVRNINSNVEDAELRLLFEQYGDIHTFYTACKHRGFILISYYDIRAARNAMRALQNKPLRHRKLDIYFSIPKGNPLEKDINQGTLVVFNLDFSVSNDDLRQIFGVYGAIKEICETPHKHHHKFIEFYDVRAAEAALRALNRSDIAGKKIKLESSHPGGARRCLMQQLFPELEQEESIGCRLGSPPNNSPPGFYAFGVPGNGSWPLGGHQYVWNNANAYTHHLPGPMLWSNSPSLLNNIPAHSPPQMHGLTRAPSHMLNTVLPLHPHHVGSEPAVNPLLWDRRQPYGGDSTDASAFHHGSLGITGFSGSSPLELASHNIYPHTGGNGIDPAHVGIHSPQQRCHMVHGRNPMIPMPASFDSPNDRVRSRRSDASANQADNKKQYELDIERIIRGEDSRTTLMIKNIPNKYTSKMLLAAIDEHHRGTYDFMYLPIDFKNKCNVGYAFINMIDPQQIIPFFQAFNGKKWEKFNSDKVASLAYARIQGKQALVAHFQNSSLMNEDKRCRPILFHSDGPNVGDQEPFPMGVNIRSRPGRSNQESPSTSPNGAGSSNGAFTSGFP